MNNILKRYCTGQDTNGLMLLDMPTGSGKTYSVIKYIYDAVQDPSNKRKYFFITTLKKNLPEEDLRNHFEKAGQLDLFKEKFLRMDSNYESVITGFTSDALKNIPAEIKHTDEYKSLEQHVNLVKNLRKENKYSLRSALVAAEDSLRKDIEPRFRRLLQGRLAKDFSRLEDRLYAIKTNKNWQWVAALYPSVYLRDKQIVFMSMDKFLSLCSTIVEPATMLYNSDVIDNAVIFIDEFDSTKETVLKTIIQNGLRDRIDYVELFNAIHSALHTHSFPAVLTSPSKKRQDGPYKNQSLQDVLSKTVEIADEIHKMFSLQFSHKTETVLDENTNNFLFQDHQYHSILNGNKSYITTTTSKTDRINTIKFTEEKPEADEGNIQIMLGKLRGFISYFMVTVRILAINYQQRKEENRNPKKDEFTLEEAIRTVLAEFKLSHLYTNYLTSQIMVSSRKYKNELQTEDFDLTFYEKGFRYYAFEDNYAHDTLSKIMMYSFQVTPEKLLLRFCEKAKVVGISATATIPSAVGNYDIQYLKEKLQDKYVTITPKEKSALKASFEESVKGYNKVNIHTKLIGGEPYSVSAWRELVGDDEVAQHLFDKIEQACSDDSKNHNKERYLRIATVFKSFLLQKDIYSFLCVLTKHPRKNNKELDLDYLIEVFELVAKCNRVPFNVKKNVVQLDGDEYDAKKDEIIKRLSNGERLFVISVYQTIGAGQNLQYPVPKGMEEYLVKTNDRESKHEKDFDAIYLDKPTNLLPLLTQALTEEEFVKYLFHVEMLQEFSELSARDTIAHVKRAFRCFSTKNIKPEHIKKINDCPSVIALSTRVIIQAVGRMCRTNLKSKNIYVYADSRIVERVDLNICDDRIFNCEFISLMDAIKSVCSAKKEQQNDERTNEAQLKSTRANKYIISMLREPWTNNRISSWKQLREMVLTHPTLSATEFDNMGIAYNFYVELPQENNKLFYLQSNDFNNIQVFFKPERGACEESSESSNLATLMKIDFLKRHFEKHGWATSFKPNRYMMSPALFNNIYRGALGEVVGKALFYQCAGVELIEIEDNDLFEKFDYIVPNTSIFVDFKNWHEGSSKDLEKELSHIANKAKECACNCVIIANIISSGNSIPRTRIVDGVKIVIVPALLANAETPVLMNAAWEEIRRCIVEYGN